MSISSLTELAVKRDEAPQGQPVKDPPNTFAASIPTEPLAAYTVFVGVVLATGITGYAAFRWGAYAVFLVGSMGFAMIAYFIKTKAQNPDEAPPPEGTRIRRRFPWAEGASALVAAAAWGLVMPGSPLYTAGLSVTALTLTTAAISGGAGLVLLGLTQVLKVGNYFTTPAAAEAAQGVQEAQLDLQHAMSDLEDARKQLTTL